jgi:hypothetical protein
LIELGLAGRPWRILLRKGAPSAWLIPYNRAIMSLHLPVEAVRQRFRDSIRGGSLQLGQSYRVWQRDWGFVLFARLWYTNTYRPFLIMKLSAEGTTGTAVKLTFVSPGVLAALAWLLAGAGLIGRFKDWGAISEMAVAAMAVHIVCCVFCLREQRDVTDDLTGVVADVLTVDQS